MNKLILKIIALSLTAMTLLTSCNDEESLQQFYVDSTEKDGFITTSIPKTILGLDESKFTPDSRKAYQSIDKVNIIALPAKEENKEQIQVESEKLNAIFKNEKYELLMSHSDDNVKVKMMYDGSRDAIDEIIIYGSSPDMGLGVARVLGNDMNVGDIMKMMKELNGNDLDPEAIKGIMGGLGIPNETMKASAE